NGSWNADPAVVLEHALRAQSYAFANLVKQTLWEISRPATTTDLAAIPHDMYLMNIDGNPISTELRASLQRAQQGRSDPSMGFDPNKVHDALHGEDIPLQDSIAAYARNFLIDPEHLPPGFDVTAHNEFRLIPKAAVKTLFRPIKGSGN